MLKTISQNANPESQMPVLEARRPSPSLGLVKLSSKSNDQIQLKLSYIAIVIGKLPNCE